MREKILKKLRKIICFASVVFVLSVVLCGVSSSEVYATNSKSDITSLQGDNTGVDVDAKKDINNGLSVTYNNDNGSLATPVKMLLVLTVLAL